VFRAVEYTASEGGTRTRRAGEGCPRQNPVRLAQPAPRLLAQIQHRESCGDWLPGTGIPRPSTRLQVLKGELVIAAKEGGQESGAGESATWLSDGLLARDRPSQMLSGWAPVVPDQQGPRGGTYIIYYMPAVRPSVPSYDVTDSTP
jgi:hypothetical protein